MFDQLANILKWFTELDDTKRTFAVMGAVVIFLTFMFMTRDKQNLKAHTEIKLEYKKRLNNCEKNVTTLQNEVIYWKDSLASEKLSNILLEVQELKKINEIVDKKERVVNKNIKAIKIKQDRIIKKLENEK
jgi:hypothetical protein